MPEHRGETRENSGRIRFFRLEPASQKHLERSCFFGVLSRRMQNTRQTQTAAFEPPKHTSGARGGEVHRAEAVARLTVCPNAGGGKRGPEVHPKSSVTPGGTLPGDFGWHAAASRLEPRAPDDVFRGPSRGGSCRAKKWTSMESRRHTS